MIMLGIDGRPIATLGDSISKKDRLKGKIKMDTILLNLEVEQGYKRVHDRIEELENNIIRYKKELEQIEILENTNLKNKSIKPSRWNWR